MAATSGDQMLERFRELAQTSRVLGWDRSKEAAKLCEVAKTHLKEQLLSAVQRGSTRPALLSYQSDGTPQLTKEHRTAHAGAIRARRIGGAGRELLVQKCTCARRARLAPPPLWRS